MRPLPHIAVAGGGMAGLTTALALARRRFPVTVFEQAPELQEVGAGLQISPNAWRVLDALGLGERLMRISIAPTAIRIRSARNGRTIARMPLGEVAEARWKAPYRVVHRADLQGLLAEAVNECPDTTLCLGTSVAGFVRDGTGLSVTTDTGTVAAFGGLVGADGIRSAVRRQVIGDHAPRYARKVAWRTTIDVADMPSGLDPAETGLWLGPDAHLVHYSVRNGREINIIAVTSGEWQEPGWSAPAEPVEIAPAFAKWPAPARALVEAPRSWKKWALADRPPTSKWGEGPVTLVGDAAHPMLPFMAQGAAMAIEDGWVLAAQLASAGDVTSGFRRYEAHRQARTTRVQRAARANGDIYHMGELASRARDLAMSVMGPERLMARWDWLFGWRADLDRRF